jgi:hypothetical protein
MINGVGDCEWGIAASLHLVKNKNKQLITFNNIPWVVGAKSFIYLCTHTVIYTA